MAAASVHFNNNDNNNKNKNKNNSRVTVKFKQPGIKENRSEFFLVPSGTPNIENYGKYMEALKFSMKHLNDRLTDFHNEGIVNAPVGIYTWIIKNDNFYATRVFTQQEIGTLHLDLDRRTGEGNITAAGELKVNSHGIPKIAFNLQSGTYTAKFNGFHMNDDIAYLFDDEDKDNPKKRALIVAVQKDAEDINTLAPIKGYDPDKSKFTVEQIKTLLRKRKPETVQPIQQCTKNRFMIYKRNRMIKDVRSKICSFFKSASCDNVVQFLYSGGEHHSAVDSKFIDDNDNGHEFEVTAGKSLLVHERNSEDDPIFTTQANFNILNGLFKEGNNLTEMIRRHTRNRSRYNQKGPSAKKAKTAKNANNSTASHGKKR